MGLKKIAILCGGGGSEHEISLTSAKFIRHQLQHCCQYDLQIFELENRNSIRNLPLDKVDFVIPAIHGRPGETGEIAAFLDLHGIPYLGSRAEASQLSFNKISTKFWLDALEIPNTPYTFLTDRLQQRQAKEFFANHQDVFIKAASQGSSIGCYHVTQIQDLEVSIDKAFKHSAYVLIEKTLHAREIEVSVYEKDGKTVISNPGEIISPNGDFYSYQEKYSKDSLSTTHIKPQLSSDVREKIKTLAHRAFIGLKLRHLARIDFFLVGREEIYLNEINTFPGMTPISMFPKLMEANGDKFGDFLEAIIESSLPKN